MKKWEKRKKTTTVESKSSPLPIDYLRLVESTLTDALAPGLTELKKTHPISTFHADGAVFADEVLLTITLFHGPDNLAATTVYASADYNPLTEKPDLQTVLSGCLDAAGIVFEHYLNPKTPEKLTQISNAALGALEDGPFEWTKETGGWVKVDKSNPILDQAAEEWLMKNDPDYQARENQAKTQELDQSAEFLEERLEAIKKAKSGSGAPGGSGPIRH